MILSADAPTKKVLIALCFEDHVHEHPNEHLDMRYLYTSHAPVREDVEDSL